VTQGSDDPRSSRFASRDASTELVREAVHSYLRANRWVAPVGNCLAAAGFAVAVRRDVDLPALIAWFVCSFTVSVLLWWSFSAHSFSQRSDRRERPLLAPAVQVMCGLCWGVTPWLSFGEDADTFHIVCLALMFAVSASALTGVSGVTRSAPALMVPMWLLGASGLIVSGDLLLAAGGLVFLVIVAADNASTSKLLAEALRLREVTAAHAERAEWEANHDALTGLPNRAGLMAIAEERRRLHSDSGSTTAMFIDLDHFKEVNDRFGHLAGDALLAEAATRLRSAVRPDDVVGRLGGDEFLVLIFREMGEIGTAKLAERIISALEEPFRLASDDVYVSGSIGITRIERRDADVHRLIHESDKALNHAKRTGRRQAVVFDAGLKAQLTERSGLEFALRKAIRSNQIEAWGQPVIELATGRVAWVELLARWEATPGSYVPPSVFIPLAEEIGVVGDLGRQMLRHASTALQRWQQHPVLAGSDAGVNISALHVIREDLVADISRLMACDNLPAQHLIIELTESHRLTDVDRVADTFRRLGTAGVRLAVDDFGTGYSSLGQLLALPVSIVKIDHSLTSGCDQDDDRASLVEAIRQLAAALGHVVVAEGVETAREAEVMARIGMDQAQGYLFCPPLPLEALEEELAKHGTNWAGFDRARRMLR
jgi:diguanylate cyclase (GGDEF)-like protein